MAKESIAVNDGTDFVKNHFRDSFWKYAENYTNWYFL